MPRDKWQMIEDRHTGLSTLSESRSGTLQQEAVQYSLVVSEADFSLVSTVYRKLCEIVFVRNKIQRLIDALLAQLETEQSIEGSNFRSGGQLSLKTHLDFLPEEEVSKYKNT